MTAIRPRRLAATALTLAILAGTTACSTGTPLDNIVEGLVQQGVDQLVGGIDDQIRGLVDDVLGDVELTGDGEVPATFPAEIALTGAVLGGGAGPDGLGWVVRTQLDDGLGFADAAAELEQAGFSAAGVSADSASGYGAYTNDAYRVDLSVATDGEGIVTATYVVTSR